MSVISNFGKVTGLTRRAVLGSAVGCVAARAVAQDRTAPIDPLHFPTVERVTYLDAAHRSPPATFVVAAGRRRLDEIASGTSTPASAPDAIEAARSIIAGALGARSIDLAFMPNTHHGLNMALSSIGLRTGDAVVIPEQEYNGVQSIGRLLAAQGVKIISSPADRRGRIALDQLKVRLRSRPKAMILSWVGFSHGARADIDVIGALCAANGTCCIVDGIQAIGLVGRPLSSLPVDAVACGSHKALLTPPGIGFLWVNPASVERFRPTIGGRGTFTTENGVGGDYMDNARRFEFGNFNQIGIAMLAAACARIAEAGLERIERHVAELSASLYETIAKLDLPIVTPNSAPERLGIITIDAGERAAYLHAQLTDKGVVTSRQGTRVRFSVGAFSTEADIRRLGSLLPLT